MIVPLCSETVSANGILPYILTRASRQYPDYTALSAKLAELYGASIYGETGKYGDTLVLKVVLTALDDRYTLDGTGVIKECAELLCSLVFDPPVEQNRFREEDTISEKRLLIERIESEINDKRKYAIRKAESILFENEPYGISKYGTVEGAKALTGESIYQAWKHALKTAFFRINFIGESDPTAIFDTIKENFTKTEREYTPLTAASVMKAPTAIKRSQEKMAVSQGKMVMGFRLNVEPDDDKAVAARVMTDIFGGGPYSRLFTNVREKLSLCYYCAARYTRQKGVLLVDSGIEEANKDKAEAEILAQLQVMKKGEFEDSELAASKMAIIDSAKTVSDSQGSIDAWFTDRLFEKNPLSPEDFAMRVQSLTKEDIIEMANQVELSTVYFLGGEGKDMVTE